MTRRGLNILRIVAAIIFFADSIAFSIGVPNNVSYNDPRLTNSIIMMCTGFIIAATYQGGNKKSKSKNNTI